MQRPPAMGDFSMSNLFRPDFIQIPTQVLTDKSLQPLDRVLFGYIYWFTKLKDGKCTAGNDTFAELTNTSEGSVKNALKRLAKSGWITKVMRNKNERKEIKCNLSYGRNGSLKAPAKVVLNDTTSGTKRYHLEKNQQREVVSNDPPEEYLIRKEIINGSPRVVPREPQPNKPLSDTAKRLQARIDAIKRNSQQGTQAA